MLKLVDVITPGTTPGVGPAPMNFWRMTMDRHLTDPSEWGKLHIMVVNTQDTYTLMEETSGAGGLHWFVVAWWLNVEPEPLPWP